jgi:hypothetical protein
VLKYGFSMTTKICPTLKTAKGDFPTLAQTLAKCKSDLIVQAETLGQEFLQRIESLSFGTP